jgi:ribosome-associated translation inhibitor RaiA
MIRIVFKDLDESELAKEAVRDRFQATIDRFPDLEGHKLSFTLSMDNSQFKPGPDLFKVKLLIAGKKYGGVELEKSAMSLYTALADVSAHALERLNRFGDKQRIRNRTQARKILRGKKIEQKGELYEENSI